MNLMTFVLAAIAALVSSPDGRLSVGLDTENLSYTVTYDGKVMLEPSPLGLEADFGNLCEGLVLKDCRNGSIDTRYNLDRCKVSEVHYVANTLEATLENPQGQQLGIEFRVSNNDVAFRYRIPRQGDTGCIRVMREATGFRFPEGTTSFLTPQSHAMIGWKRSKPSYEEEYRVDAPLGEKSFYGHGYTFPCLFRVGEDGWVLLSETGVGSNYCGSHLSDIGEDGTFCIAFPMPEENNGNGTVEPAFQLPGATPWRTITVGNSLKPVVETTAPWDNVEPLYESTHQYRFGRSSWSWIIWQDASMNWDDQVAYIDLAAALGLEYILIDAGWDQQIGYSRMEDLVAYAHSKGVDVFLWYSSSGWWNDIQQSPVGIMDNSILRKKEMAWMEKIGVKGIKVDFWGGDKQETMRLYEQLFSDADDHGLMVICHGCTLPRGWERMYPNYVGSEAVLASENLVFNQRACDMEAFSACLHPFIRNTVGCMEFGGCVLNSRLGRGDNHGTVRRTTVDFELATEIIFQNPIQTLAVTPENLNNVELSEALDFVREFPTTWDETVYIDGYPGKSVTLRRRHGSDWWEAHIDASGKGYVKKL